MSTKASSTEIVVNPIATESLTYAVLGTTPIILNRMSEKARREILMPSGPKTAAAKASSLKHDPLVEFRAAPYTLTDPEAPTLLACVATAFKGAMCTAALDLPGAKKTQVGRLVYVEGQYLPLYGVPELFMAVTRNSDINRTPDIRTRTIVPAWAARITVTFASPLLNARSITNLLAAAGVICGVGDWRPEKGKGSFGQFTLVDPEDERFLELIENGGRTAQVEAMANPSAYDTETEELLSWFETEVETRGKRLKAVA